MNTILRISEPWNFKTPEGNNFIEGRIISKNSHEIIFKSKNLRTLLLSR